MQYLQASKREIDRDSYRRGAVESDCETLITDSTTVMCDGQTVAVYIANIRHPVVDAIKAVLPNVQTIKDIRTSGLVTNSRIFGFAPRNELRKHPCRATVMASDQPTEHSVVASGAEVVAQYYLDSMPEVAAHHRQVTSEKVKPEYMLGESMFTSGIINRNNPLQYHFDSGNFGNCCSAMLGFKSDVEGGMLCVPELNLKFEIGDRSLLLFDGQGLLHGVTPIVKRSPTAMRFTVVYYSLQQMWNCEYINDELERARSKRSAAELNARNNKPVSESSRAAMLKTLARKKKQP